MTPEEIRQQEAERVRAIHYLCEKYRIQKVHREHMLDNNLTIEEARAYVLNMMNGGQQQQPIAQPVNPLGLSDREQRKYSLCKAILSVIDPSHKDDAPFEREISSEIAKQTGRSTSGLFIPVRDLRVPWLPVANPMQQRATYAVGGAATGGATVETMLDAANMIEYLRNQILIARLGATMLSGLVGNVDVPRQAGIANTCAVEPI